MRVDLSLSPHMYSFFCYGAMFFFVCKMIPSKKHKISSGKPNLLSSSIHDKIHGISTAYPLDAGIKVNSSSST